MATDKWDLTGVHGINKFLWSKLQEELGWNKSNYGGLIPIVPAAQQPILNDYASPYVVYNYSHQPTGTDYWITEEQISYVVYSSNESDIRRFINVVREHFNKWDESAGTVNDWIQANGSVENKRFDYKTIRPTPSMGAQPPVAEGGRQDGTIGLRIQYTYYDFVSGQERLAL